jgi:hypothetical protein
MMKFVRMGSVVAAVLCVVSSATDAQISAALAASVRDAAEMTAAAERKCYVAIGVGSAWAARARVAFVVAQAAAGTPRIASLSPTSGPVGTLVTIQGTNFTSSNTIHFSSAQTSFAAGSPVNSQSGTSLQFQVSSCPSHAPQCPGVYIPPGSYNVTVSNANGTSNAATFAVTPP